MQRLMRSVVLSVKENEYVVASEAMGASKLRILVLEIIPNSISSVLIMATTDVGNKILMFSTLSFLGLGSAPPTPEWGMMVSDGVNNFSKFGLPVFPVWLFLQWLSAPILWLTVCGICWIQN